MTLCKSKSVCVMLVNLTAKLLHLLSKVLSNSFMLSWRKCGMAPKIRTIGSVYFEDYRLFRWSECKGIAGREMGQKRLFPKIFFFYYFYILSLYTCCCCCCYFVVAIVAAVLLIHDLTKSWIPPVLRSCRTVEVTESIGGNPIKGF